MQRTGNVAKPFSEEIYIEILRRMTGKVVLLSLTGEAFEHFLW